MIFEVVVVSNLFARDTPPPGLQCCGGDRCAVEHLVCVQELVGGCDPSSVERIVLVLRVHAGDLSQLLLILDCNERQAGQGGLNGKQSRILPHDRDLQVFNLPSNCDL